MQLNFLSKTVEDTYKFVEKLKENDVVCEMITLKGAKHAFILFGYQSSDEEAESYMKMTMKQETKFIRKGAKPMDMDRLAICQSKPNLPFSK